MGFSLKGYLSGLTGGIVGSGQAPQQAPQSQGDQSGSWSPSLAENDFVNNNFGQDVGALGDLQNGGLRKETMGTISNFIRSKLGPSSDTEDEVSAD